MMNRIFFWVRLVAAVNIVLVGLGAIALGGDAVSGHAEGGHYFLGSGGKFVEVSRGVWLYSYIHMVSNFVTFGLAVIVVSVKEFRGVVAAFERPPSASPSESVSTRSIGPTLPPEQEATPVRNRRDAGPL